MIINLQAYTSTKQIKSYNYCKTKIEPSLQKSSNSKIQKSKEEDPKLTHNYTQVLYEKFQRIKQYILIYIITNTSTPKK